MPQTIIRQAVILVGGRGTRLGALTQEVPKPMLPVGGRPFLEYQVAWLRTHGVTRILFCTGYLSRVVEQHFGDGRMFGVRADYSVEAEPAGTGGCLRLARTRLEDCFFVLNGDTLFECDLPCLAGALMAEPQALGCVALREVEDTARYGSVALDQNRIRRFVEKGNSGRGWINGGVYCLRRAAVDLLPPGPCSVERDLFPQLAAGSQLLGRPSIGYFIDIGLPETLGQAQAELPGWLRTLESQQVGLSK